MSITFSGLATGLDTDSIVKELMAIERVPLERVQAKKADEKQRLDAYAQFKSKLDSLKSAVGQMTLSSQIRTTKVSLSSEEALTASTTSGALGSYNVSVGQLSQVQKTVSDGFSSNTDALFGTGTLTVNGVTINVSSENNSLSGLAASVNELSKTTGVTATIINDGNADNPYHLVFTGENANTTFEITSNLVDATATPIDFNTSTVQSAQQAVAFIDGIKVVSATNTISTAISGVAFNLDAVSSTTYSWTPEAGVDPWDWADPPIYKTTRVDIKADTDTLKEKITSFVTAYNDAMEWILSGYDEFGGSSEIPATDPTDGEEVALGAVLRGDATINSLKRQLQNTLTDSINNSGEYHILSEIGIATNPNGTLRQDNSKLDNALANNFEDMVALLSGDETTDGVMKDFNSLLLDMTNGTKGMYASKKTAFENASVRFDSQIDQMELRLAKREKALKAQFSAMEKLVSSLNAQGDFFTQQMDALNGNKK